MKYTCIYTDPLPMGAITLMERIEVPFGSTIETELNKNSIDLGQVVFIFTGWPSLRDETGWILDDSGEARDMTTDTVHGRVSCEYWLRNIPFQVEIPANASQDEKDDILLAGAIEAAGLEYWEVDKDRA